MNTEMGSSHCHWPLLTSVAQYLGFLGCLSYGSFEARHAHNIAYFVSLILWEFRGIGQLQVVNGWDRIRAKS